MFIDELLAAVGAADCRCERAVDHDEDRPAYTVYVPRARLEAVEAAFRAHPAARTATVLFRQETPPLVPARPGDVVRVYSEYATTDDESPVGVVTGVQEGPGGPAYGCSYIQLALGNSYVSDVYSWHLTAEDYGGYHKGFLRVIDPAELPAILAGMIDRGYAKAVEKAAAMRAAAMRVAPALAAALRAGTTARVERWGLREAEMPSGVSDSLPRLYTHRL